jgi:cytochrome c biogenesis protein CcdA/thiol-disulfide isomerase/thioredoxin
MVALLAVGFVAGVVTAISPCVLPVLPVVFAGGATGGWRRSVGIASGLAISFAAATLFGEAVLNALHLPLDVLNYVGRVLLIVLGVSLLIDPIAALLERPFARLQVRPKVTTGTRSGLVLGAGLGLVFVPCAGPILAAISVAGARERFSASAIFLTIAYALGAAIPLLVIALLSGRLSTTWSVVRRHARTVRRVSGVVIAAMGIVIWTGALTSLQTATANAFASSFESHLVNGSCSLQDELLGVSGEHANRYVKCGVTVRGLPDLGPAANFTGITAWLNTPGNKPLTLHELHGKVVLVDFWTYSCINCRRSLPHVEAWYRAYHKYGLVIVGVHTPEFAFEHVVGNVTAAATQLGVTYPVAVDNNYATWDAYNNMDWPAEYLIDEDGEVRHTSFGEGDYAQMETDIRALLVAGGAKDLPAPTDVANRTPTNAQSPETYLGWQLAEEHQVANIDTDIAPDVATNYQLPNPLPSQCLAFGGTWDVHTQEATAGADAVLEFAFTAQDVYLVLGGTGTVTASYDGNPPVVVHVHGIPNLYTMYAGAVSTNGTLLIHASPGVRAFDFTFG